jgi:methylmalonyl-CoA mutase
MGTEYARALADAGLSVDLAFAQVEFRLSATADQFATIAKLRAARQLWSRVAEVSGVQQDAVAGAGAMRQHVVTSWSMLSRRDPWVNLLRGTVAAFGAGVGGAQSVTVLPFDAALGLPDSMARRLARNTSALLIEESHVGRVIDPAGGSWFIENLTQEVAEAAWALFTAMEGRGGFTADLASGNLASSLAKSAQERSVRIAHRRDPLTGVSEFPDVHETPLVRKTVSTPAPRGLPRARYAEGFETLRDRSDGAPEHPRVVLVAIGEVSDYTARATFAKNFYEAGGIRAETIVFSPSARAEISATGLACICSSDAVYSDQAVAVAQTLTGWGIKQVHLAGPGGELKDALMQSGVSVFVSLGVDVIDVLTTALNECGVAQ